MGPKKDGLPTLDIGLGAVVTAFFFCALVEREGPPDEGLAIFTPKSGGGLWASGLDIKVCQMIYALDKDATCSCYF